MDHYDVTVSKEYNTPAMLQDIIDNQQTHTDISMASAEFRNFVLNSEGELNIATYILCLYLFSIHLFQN